MFCVLVPPSEILGGVFQISKTSVPNNEQILNDSITISASNVGNFAKGFEWHLSVNAKGQAVVTIHSHPQRKTRQFQLSEKQLSSFRRLIVETKFFQLKSRYGDVVPSGNSKLVTITIGQFTHSVRLDYLSSSNPSFAKEEAAQSVKVILAVRNWFDDLEAFDHRPYSKNFLKKLARQKKM